MDIQTWIAGIFIVIAGSFLCWLGLTFLLHRGVI
jgi:hypothetical protein